MTSAVQPVPVGETTKEGPNKILLAVLGILVAGAVFMFVVKPLLLDSKPSVTTQAPATTKAQTGAAADPAAKDGSTKSPGGAAAPTAPATDGGGEGAAPAPVSAATDALPQIPAQYAGQPARDPFAPLVQGTGSSGGSTSAKGK